MRPIPVVLLFALSACAPDRVGEQVGQSLYQASVSTGRALAVAGDRTGRAIETAGTGLRNAVNPPPPAYALPPGLPPPSTPDGYAPPVPVGVEPLGGTAPNPAVGY